MRKFIGAVLLGAGLLVVPANVGLALADDQTVVQNQNSSQDSTATSGDATAGNTAVYQSGPQANSGAGDAQASQIGDNNSSVHQNSSAKSGDAAAGSQITGVSGGGTVQNQNTSSGDIATSGNANAFNVAVVAMGPVANSGLGNAQASQNGSNNTELVQDAVSTSGDAVAGSQVTGIV